MLLEIIFSSAAARSAPLGGGWAKKWRELKNENLSALNVLGGLVQNAQLSKTNNR
jgi:hypothetical protein